MIDAAPPFPPHVMQCVRSAVDMYRVPKIILLSILVVEGGRNGMARKNKNGTHDFGMAQINTIWVKKLRNQYGISNAKNLLQYNGCYNIHAGAWILKTELQGATIRSHDFWKRVGNYHSRNERLNLKYQGLVYKAMLKIQKTKWQ